MKKGDKVRIRKDSRFYGEGNNNPENETGIIVGLDKDDWFSVEWGVSRGNKYMLLDLEMVETDTTHRETAKIVMYVLNKLNELEFETKNDDELMGFIMGYLSKTVKL